MRRTLEDATTDGDRRCEWALLINICTLDGLLWGLKAQTNRLVITDDTVRLLGRDTGEDLGNTLLLLESALDLVKGERERESGGCSNREVNGGISLLALVDD